MSNEETFTQIVKRLKSEGRLNIQQKMYYCRVTEEWQTLESLREFYKDDLEEIAALCALDGANGPSELAISTLITPAPMSNDFYKATVGFGGTYLSYIVFLHRKRKYWFDEKVEQAYFIDKLEAYKFCSELNAEIRKRNEKKEDTE